MVGGEAGNAVSKLCTGQATKNGLVNYSAELWECTGMKKWQINEAQKGSMCGHIQLQNKKIKNELAKMQFCSKRDKIVVRKAGNAP